MISNPKSLLLGAAAQLGIFTTYIGREVAWSLPARRPASIGIIGGADGPTAIFVTSKLAPELLGAIAVAAYSYMALVPIIQPPIMSALTTKKERMIVMEQLRPVSKTGKDHVPDYLHHHHLSDPAQQPCLCVGMLMLGNLMKESGVVDRINKTAGNELMNIITIFLGVSVGCTTNAETFLNKQHGCIIVALGLIAFCFGTAGGVLFGKMMCWATQRQGEPADRFCRCFRCSDGRTCFSEGRPAGKPPEFPAYARHGAECCGRNRQRCGRRYPDQYVEMTLLTEKAVPFGSGFFFSIRCKYAILNTIVRMNRMRQNTTKGGKQWNPNLKHNSLQLRKKYIEAQFGKLNPVQRDAVFTTDGPLLILAGAGSGKTTVLVNRIANLIRFGSAHSSTYAPQGAGPEQVAELERLLHSGGEPSEALRPFLLEHTVRPYHVLAITFTNKAAGELKNRLSAMLGEAGQDVNASTFHSACVRILRREAGRLGYPQSFTIYDTDDQQRAMKEVYKSMNIDDKFLPLKSAIGAIGRLKDKMISPQDAMSAPADTRAGLVAKVYDAYQKRLLQAGAFDFDDLIYATVKLLRDFEDVREYYQNRLPLYPGG